MNDLIKTKRFFNCLSCSKGVFWIEHLIDDKAGRTWGPWYCDDCGEGHRGTAGKGRVHVELSGEKRLWKAVLLKLDPDAGDVYLTVRGMHFSKDGEMPERAWHEDGAQYYYDEHTCPTNYLRSVIEILQVMPGGEESTDPHGIFEYVMSAPIYTDEGLMCDDVQLRLDMFKAPSEETTT